jgi:hypothetical protein
MNNLSKKCHNKVHLFNAGKFEQIEIVALNKITENKSETKDVHFIILLTFEMKCRTYVRFIHSYIQKVRNS